mmetsp:Transcript_18826/g.60150  ORF Transcript_18826/g.60150 Transcript_18826/m.60150 type:complete len:242 (-) Transcript_18826:225-950(-)
MRHRYSSQYDMPTWSTWRDQERAHAGDANSARYKLSPRASWIGPADPRGSSAASHGSASLRTAYPPCALPKHGPKVRGVMWMLSAKALVFATTSGSVLECGMTAETVEVKMSSEKWRAQNSGGLPDASASCDGSRVVAAVVKIVDASAAWCSLVKTDILRSRSSGRLSTMRWTLSIAIAASVEYVSLLSALSAIFRAAVLDVSRSQLLWLLQLTLGINGPHAGTEGVPWLMSVVNWSERAR